jgi:acyl-CoA synthetase (AMP-forming)/AMP-acid ligase II
MPSLATAPFRTVKAALESKAAQLEGRTFFHYRGSTYSFAEVELKANAIANKLHKLGVSQGDTVCLSMYNRPEYIYLLFALAKLGVVAAPIDTRFSGETLTYVLSMSDAETIVLDDDTRREYKRVSDRVSNITEEYYVDDASGYPYRDFSHLLEGETSEPPEVDVSGPDTFTNIYIQRNSTELPKGVLLPHYSYVNTAWETAERIFDLSPADCVFTTLPMYSSYPIQMGVMGALLTDAEFAFAKKFDPDSFWSLIDQYGATVFLYLGRMVSVLQNSDVSPDDDENPTEYAIGHGFGFETDQELITDFEERFGVTVLEGYGTTPTATVATFNHPEERKIGTVGKSVSYVDIQIVDEDDWPVSRGETGEIVVRPTQPHTVMQGFHDAPAETVETWKNQWIHTGDIGYLDEDGYLYYIANKEDSIQLGRVAGRISSLEVESVLDAHADVRESVVLGVTNELGDEDIKAVVVPDDGHTPSPMEICQYCERQLAYKKVPRYIEIRNGLPRSPSGKILIEKLTGVSRAEVWDRESGYELSR